MQFQFRVPQCLCAPDSALKIGELAAAAGCKNILCIYDKGVKSAGIVDPILNAIHATGLRVTVFDGVQPDPSVEVVTLAGRTARECGADAIVAVGGGSSIDTAKIASFLAVSEKPVQDYYAVGSVDVHPLPLFAIPTTSGTGSEITPAAVVSDPALGRKVTLVDPKMMAAWAILDPKLTLGLPRGMTAATGMDALAHAIEGMTCIRHNPLTDGLALTAIKLIIDNLPPCVEDGQNLEARSNMLLASSIAGMAFGNTAAHVGHAFAHAMGAVWHIPHGIGCALALPYAIKNCCTAAYDQVLAIARALGIADAAELSTETLADRLANCLAQFSSSVGIPTLHELKIDRIDLDKIVEATLNEKPLILLSGEPVTQESCRAYYEELFMQ